MHRRTTLVTLSLLFLAALPLLAVDDAARARVTALSRALAITPYPPLPDGVTAATLDAGSKTPTLLPPVDPTPAQRARIASDAAFQGPVAIRRRNVMLTPSGLIATAPLDGLTAGSHVVVHSDGTVAAYSAAGDVLWNHASFEVTAWTGRFPPPNSGGDRVPSTPFVTMGFDPINPYLAVSANPFVTGDLTGDGVDDIAIAHLFFKVISIDGNGGSMLTLLDGVTGNRLWSTMYPGRVSELAIHDGYIVVASDTGDANFDYGQNGTVSSLDAWRMTPAGGGVVASFAWTISTGVSWAKWLALEKLPGGRIAAAWTRRPLGDSSTDFGRLLVAPLSTGVPTWTVTAAGYPRFIRFDSSRNQLITVEEADPYTNMSYTIVARNVSTGASVTSATAAGGVALSFQTGDLEGDGPFEWVVSDLLYVPCTDIIGCTGTSLGGRVRALDGATGTLKWEQDRRAEAGPPERNPSTIPRPYRLLLAPRASGADVVVGSFMPGAEDVELQLLRGATTLEGVAGTVAWWHRQMNLFNPQFISLYQQGGGTFVRTASSRIKAYGAPLDYLIDGTGVPVPIRTTTPYQAIRLYNVATGQQASEHRLLGRIHAMAPANVNADAKKDFIVGGESGAVFALDGNHIDDHPVVLWRRTVAGPVHHIVAADLTGDGQSEVIVAATHATHVLDRTTGAVLHQFAGDGAFLCTFTIADVNGDGRNDVIVPSKSLTAYSGANGAVLWNYAPSGLQSAGTTFSNVVVTAGRVVAQFVYGTEVTSFNRGVVALDAATGTVSWSDSTSAAVPALWRGTVGGFLDGRAGAVVGLTWFDISSTFLSLRLELRDAATGTLINSMPPPSDVGGNRGTTLIPERGVVAWAFAYSWMVNPVESGRVMGADQTLDVARGNFGVLGPRVVQTTWSESRVRVFPQNALPITPATGGSAVEAVYYHRITSDALNIHDLDGDGIDEIIRTPWNYDGFATLVTATQGPAGLVTTHADGLDILEVHPSTPPTARLSAAVVKARAPFTAVFDASASFDTDPGDRVVSFTMNFGDGSPEETKSAPVITHVYQNPGLYTARLTVKDSTGRASVNDAVIVIEVVERTVPGAPVIGAATPGDRQAQIAFLAPTDDGGSPITSYTVSCNGITATGAASPIIVSGLTNGTTYSCSCVATNASGSSAPSASVAVTPNALLLPVLSDVEVVSSCQRSSVFTIALNGSGFVSGAVAKVNGADRTTTLVSSTQLRVTVLDTDLPASRQVTLNVLNPDGGLSNSLLATIALPGDLDLDGRTNALDLLILAHYLAGNVQPETAPFNALLSAANLNGDAVVNVVDVVILANHLAENIPCLPSK